MVTYTTKNQYLSTDQFAEVLKGKPSTIRTRLCKTGSFYGITPIKLPSGRLLWPAEAVQALLTGKGVLR
jgi:hypothetical protein